MLARNHVRLQASFYRHAATGTYSAYTYRGRTHDSSSSTETHPRGNVHPTSQALKSQRKSLRVAVSHTYWQNRPQAKSPNRHTYPSIYAEKARTSSQTTYIMSDSNGLHQRPLSYQSPSIGQVEQALEVAHSCGDTLDSMRYTYGFQSIILAAKCNSSCA